MSQRLYEGMFLFDSNTASRDWPGLERHVEELLKRNGAELVYSERWPDRKLAYEIKGCKKGTYYLTYFNAPPGSITGLERDCRLSERVLRLMVVRDQAVDELLERRRNRIGVESTGSEGGGDEGSSQQFSPGRDRPRYSAPERAPEGDLAGLAAGDDLT